MELPNAIGGRGAQPFKGCDDIFRQLIANSFDMIVLLDEHGSQHYVSESCQRILGYAPEELTGIRVIDEMIHPEDREAVREGFGNILSNATSGGTQYRHRHKEGGWVYLEAFGSNKLAHPLLHSIVLNVRDVTERKQAEIALMESQSRLLEANQSKDRLISVIAHDLINPFNAIINLGEFLEEELAEGNLAQSRETTASLLTASRGAYGLLTELLAWARAQSGHVDCNPAQFDLTQSVEEVILTAADMARQKTIGLSHVLPAPMPIHADRKMVQTILRNLVNNSIKFTEPGGQVTIAATREGPVIQVSVRDNGVGIPPQNLDKLFNIKDALSTPGTRQEKGTGLGLSLCRQFVHMHGGKIWAEAVQSGSLFRFTLPQP